MNASAKYRLLGLLAVACALCCDSGESQESVDTLLERGYVANWLVCGPFEPDAPGGIIAAVSDDRRPLGSKDYMAPEGGIARIRPQALMEIRSERKTTFWRRARANDALLDLSPFFSNDVEGVSYAAFYVECGAPREMYADLQTPLGARASEWFSAARGLSRACHAGRCRPIYYLFSRGRLDLCRRSSDSSTRFFLISDMARRGSPEGWACVQRALGLAPHRYA
ncbi:MAG: hypothetical protein QGG73_11395 [Candidatus Hydrogenedentes bacterium]|jgi:hypothetical protein|nr:hypothetical protein [Candidatus Hydrogenedentota bacterium]